MSNLGSEMPLKHGTNLLSDGSLRAPSYPVPPRPHARHSIPREIPQISDDDTAPDAPETEDGSVEPGMLLESKDLYRSDPRSEWGVWAPDDIGVDAKETESSAKFALIVKRDKIQDEDGSSALKLHSIQVQSPLIKELLEPVLQDYPGIKTSLRKLRFSAPFREFFYRWNGFVQACEKSKDDDLKAAHFKLLFDIISAEIEPHIEEVTDLVKNEVINFTYLWAIFEPEMDVYSLVDGHHRLYRMKSAKYVELPNGTQLFQLSCQFVDTDGTNFGYNVTTLTIGAFSDVLPIMDLTVVPARVKPDIDTIRAQLIQRGRKFESLNGCHYKAYAGEYMLANVPWGHSRKTNLRNGRVMIDDAMYDRYNKGAEKTLRPLEESIGARIDVTTGTIFDLIDSDLFNTPYVPPHLVAYEYAARETKRRLASVQTQMKRETCTSLTEEHYAYCSSTVRGFCLTSKQWVSLYVDTVSGISWSVEAFERLVLPHDYKRLIKGFVHTQLSATDEFDDVMSGKGQGIIMLLCGEPGTGKTLTAESVAEDMRSPLYSIGAGELGESADEVETNLRRVLEISTKWAAVLLLDECDVFLEKRSSKSVQRNKLVSVFLRLLEYYQGVMFLTTNRLEAHDPAFESRIHLTIQFPKLDFDSRLHIWRTFVRPMNSESKYASNIDDDELSQLASSDLNGRQIKNVVKTSRLLAASESKTLDIDHVKAVLRVKQVISRTQVGHRRCSKRTYSP